MAAKPVSTANSHCVIGFSDIPDSRRKQLCLFIVHAAEIRQLDQGYELCVSEARRWLEEERKGERSGKLFSVMYNPSAQWHCVGGLGEALLGMRRDHTHTHTHTLCLSVCLSVYLSALHMHC